MPQEQVDVDHWELDREDKRLIPLIVRVETAPDVWTETTNYTVVCLPVGTRPASGAGWVAPVADAGRLGYLMNGLVLDPLQLGGNFWGFTKGDGSVQDPVDPAFTLRLR